MDMGLFSMKRPKCNLDSEIVIVAFLTNYFEQNLLIKHFRINLKIPLNNIFCQFVSKKVKKSRKKQKIVLVLRFEPRTTIPKLLYLFLLILLIFTYFYLSLLISLISAYFYLYLIFAKISAFYYPLA